MQKYTPIHNFKTINVTNRRIGFLLYKNSYNKYLPFSTQQMKPSKVPKKPTTRHRKTNHSDPEMTPTKPGNTTANAHKTTAKNHPHQTSRKPPKQNRRRAGEKKKKTGTRGRGGRPKYNKLRRGREKINALQKTSWKT